MSDKKTSTHNAWNTKIVDKPTEASESNLIALLDRLNKLSKMLHNKTYEATRDYEETGNVFFDGQGEAFEMCKIFVDDIIKSV